MKLDCMHDFELASQTLNTSVKQKPLPPPPSTITSDILINRQILFYDKLKLQSGESYSEHDDEDEDDNDDNDDDDNKFLNLNLNDNKTQQADSNSNSNNNTSLSDDVDSDFSSTSHSPPHSSSSSCCSSLSSTEESDDSSSFNTNTNKNESSSHNYSTIFSLKEHPLYRIQEKIRSGGFGDVYKGIRKTDNMPIAIKVIEKKKIVSWTTNEVSEEASHFIKF